MTTTPAERARETLARVLADICELPHEARYCGTESDAILAALSEAGLTIVPVEPTSEMIKHGQAVPFLSSDYTITDA